MISFLLGSGFSIDEGIPGLQAINQKFINTKADNIFLGSDQSAGFLKEGAKDPNGWFPDNVSSRMFFEEFIQFYCNKIINGSENFNYEEFIDYFYLPRKQNKYPKALKSFLDAFRIKYSLEKKLLNDNTNLLFRFYNMFAQLLANQLLNIKYFEDATCFGYIRYGAFIGFLSRLLENGQDLKVHSLNHDMLFDFLGSKQSSLWQHYCDGFEKYDSPYFGILSTKIQDITKTYNVKLKYYTGKYDKKLSFFKLHGSIDTYIFNMDNRNTDFTRIKTDLGIGEFYKEITNELSGKKERLKGYQYKYPDFLSGTTYKMLFYSDEYYKNLHTHFRKNLTASNVFIVIGYGFKDKGINEMIQKSFLDLGNKMFVIDPFPNEEFLKNKSNIEIIHKGVNELSHEEWDKMLIKN